MSIRALVLVAALLALPAALPAQASPPVVVVDAVWQYSHHVLAGLRAHRGPILIVANWSGQFPGLVGLLNLTASLTKADIAHAILWSEDFTDAWARTKLAEWLETGTIAHATEHVRDLPALPESEEARLGTELAAQLRDDHAVIGVFDEGCMGMYNAIIDDELLNPIGIYKERLSQSALWAEMQRVGDDEAADVAILHHVLHFAQQPGAAIAEAARALGPGGRLLIADFASHDREELRTRDAHVRLGFSDAQIEGWFETAGLTPARTDVLDGGELTVKLWLGQKPGVHLREVKAA